MRTLITIFIILIPVSLYGQTWWDKHTVDNGLESMHEAAVGDIDGDGDLDLVGKYIDSSGDQHEAWFENLDGTGTNLQEHIYSDHSEYVQPNRVETADLDGDGDLDIIGVRSDYNRLYWWENTDGSGNYWDRHSISGYDPYLLTTFDMEGDGDVDILITPTEWLENTEGDAGTWTKHTIETGYSTPETHIADMDGDGDMDLVASGGSGKTVVSNVLWCENTDGSGTSWTTHDVDTDFGGSNELSATDIDGDGDMDIVASGGFDHEYARYAAFWYENKNSEGTSWDRYEIYDTYDENNHEFNISGVYHADIDLDGDSDVILTGTDPADVGFSSLYWLENTEDNKSEWPTHAISSFSDGDLTIADINSDGYLDLLKAGGSYLTWFENKQLTLALSTEQAELNWRRWHSSDSATVTLSNETPFDDITWEIVDIPTWLSVTPDSITIDEGGSADIILAGNQFPGVGTYTDTLTIRTVESGQPTYLEVTLSATEPARVSANEEELSFEWRGKETAPSDTVTLVNISDENADWSATHTSDWIKVTPDNGDLAGGDSVEVALAGDQFPGAGVHSDKLIFKSESQDIADTLEVRLRAWAPFPLTADISGFNFLWQKETPPTEKTATISNNEDHDIHFRAAKSSDWLGIDPDTSTIAAGEELKVTLYVENHPGSPGKFEDEITFYDMDDGVRYLLSFSASLEVDFSWEEYAVGQIEEDILKMSPVDMDNDGDQDVFVATKTDSGGIYWFKNTGGDGKTWMKEEIISTDDDDILYYKAAEVLDMDGDGDMDVFTYGEDSDRNPLYISNWWENKNFYGTSWEKHSINTDLKMESTALGDLNNDDNTDLIYTEDQDVFWITDIGRAETTDDLEGSSIVSNYDLGNISSESISIADMKGIGDKEIVITYNKEEDNGDINAYFVMLVDYGVTSEDWRVRDKELSAERILSHLIVDLNDHGNVEMLVATKGVDNANNYAYIKTVDGSETNINGEGEDGVTYSNLHAGDIDDDGDLDVLAKAHIESSDNGSAETRLTCFFNGEFYFQEWKKVEMMSFSDDSVLANNDVFYADFAQNGYLDVLGMKQGSNGEAPTLTWWKQLELKDDRGVGNPVSGRQIPNDFSVSAGYPNPFNPTITVPFSLPEAGRVQVTVYNIMGQKLMAEELNRHAGNHTYRFNAGAALSSGMYFIQFRYGNQSAIQKVTLIK